MKKEKKDETLELVQINEVLNSAKEIAKCAIKGLVIDQCEGNELMPDFKYGRADFDKFLRVDIHGMGIDFSFYKEDKRIFTIQMKIRTSMAEAHRLYATEVDCDNEQYIAIAHDILADITHDKTRTDALVHTAIIVKDALNAKEYLSCKSTQNTQSYIKD